MPGEQGDLPASPPNIRMERPRETFAMRVKRGFEALAGKPERQVGQPLHAPIAPPEIAATPETEAKQKGWLFQEESELDGLPPSVHVALRHAERTNERPANPMTADTLRMVYTQIDKAVLSEQVELEAVQEQLIKIGERVAELDQQNKPQVQPQTIDVSPLTQAVERLTEVAEAGRSRTEQSGEANGDRLAQSIDQMAERMRELLSSRAVSPEVIERSANRDTAQLLELLGKGDPSNERERWAQAEFEQDFYARFQPNMEPRFYTNMDYEHRAIMDARWQLARASFTAKILSGRAEDYVTKNQELSTLTEEQMKRLYEMPGVRPALEWYVDVIYNNRKIKMSDGKEITVFECSSEKYFKEIRRIMRDQALGKINEGPEVNFGQGKEPMSRLEADAVAWNLVNVTNLLESLDSRYSRSGRRHAELSGQFASDEIRALLHPQEKFEDKMSSGQPWGVFTGWGLTQMDLIKKAVGGISRDDKVRFVEARKMGDFWTHKVGKEDGQRVITIKTPECYPTTTAGSYWERWRLLDKLVKKQPIDWDEVDSGSWARYLFTTLNQGLKLVKYYNPGTPIEYGKPGWANKWTGEGIEEAIGRLGLDNRLSDDELHNLKVWAVYGGIGMKDYGSKVPHINASDFDKGNMEAGLRDQRIGYLKQSRFAGPFAGERLNIVDLPPRK